MNTQDVIVIGSGFGGAVSASNIAEAGFKVKILERGPWRDSLPNASQGIPNRVPFPSEGLNFWTKVVRTLRNNKLPGGRLTLNINGFYEAHIGKALNIVCSSNVGGGSHAYGGLNMLPAKSNYWDDITSGLSEEQMAGHYDSVFGRMGSSVPGDEHIPLSIRKRFSDSDSIQSDDEVGNLQMGFLFPKEAGNPQEVTTEDGVRRCEIAPNEGGFLGSPKGGKTSLDVAYLYQAIKHGLEICDLQEVLAIRKTSEPGKPRYCVKVENHHTGEFEDHFADHVIFAAGTLNTLHLLLQSREGEKGLGGMPQLGKSFGSNGDLFAYWNLQNKGQDMTQSLPVNGYVRLKSWDEENGATQPTIVETPMPSPNKLRLPSWLANKMRQGTMVAGMGEDAMDGTVSLKNGKLNVDYNPDNSSIFRQIRDQMDRIAKSTDKRILSFKRPTTVHPLGGACIGRDISAGVIDDKGEVFDHPGLYVADAAALPKPVAAPPAMTIAAWANHVAEQLIVKLQKEKT